MVTHALGSQVPPPLLLPPLPLPPLLLLPPEPLPLLLPLLPLLPPLLPPPAHVTGDHSAATAAGVQPGSLVCAWRHWYVAPWYVTSCPTEYAFHSAHGVAVAHCAADSAWSPETEPSSLPAAQPMAAPNAAKRSGRAVCLVMPP